MRLLMNVAFTLAPSPRNFRWKPVQRTGLTYYSNEVYKPLKVEGGLVKMWTLSQAIFMQLMLSIALR